MPASVVPPSAPVDFRPVLYLKAKCPFCLKVQIYLLEAGVLGEIEQREFAVGSALETEIRAELAQHFEVASFPTLQVAPGQYLSESDDIIALYAARSGVRPESCGVYTSFMQGMLPRQIELYAEVARLQGLLAECTGAK